MIKSTFCPLPFIHLATHPIGTVTPCCETIMTNGKSTAQINGKNLLLGHSTISEIFNTEVFKKTRTEMLSNRRPDICSNCYHKDDLNVASKRQISLEEFPQEYKKWKKVCKEDGEISNVQFEYIELRLGNTCNLKCMTCNPFSSSKWNEDVEVFEGTDFSQDYFKLEDKSHWYKDSKFYDELLSHCRSLKKININGGEPTIINMHFYFLELLIKNGLAQNIELEYFINLTNIPDLLISLWKHFKRVHVNVSIDDIGKRNDYIRYGSNWEIIEESLKKLLNLNHNITISITQSVSLLNVANLNAMKKYSLIMGIPLSFNFVRYPSFFHVANLPLDLKETYFQNAYLLNIEEKESLKAEMFCNYSQLNRDLFLKYCEFIKILDKKRGIDIVDFLPEWRELIR